MDEQMHTPDPSTDQPSQPPKPPQPSYVSETVLEDETTHPAYMSLMFWAAVTVGILGGLALLAMFALAWNDKTVPDAFGSIPQWAVIILGVLLVGDALLGKLAVKP